ncbi:hypothetical protein [Janthinobacterium sp. 17J80-10]|uniref:hypothetical protein n=1 Tax=Janthinobacterium sp. 17J80-10 TaxID=2497863 RepID=UPI0010059599|nr:hypothetical protein [Janthinobacterium sp. 17J80-10]QAU34993.1 hypothetical protein EKL02_12830 [Janthinobacterium sp. 17J80-10]
MFNSNFATYPYVSPVHSYSENLGRAARSFIAALLAIDPARVEAAPVLAKATEDKAATAAELSRLAREFDAFMPNQAAELRYLAGRD